jgi:spore cortex formation protein SpoVR/YcgB (stage V sporulation)
MKRLWDKGLILDGHYLEFIHSHANVTTQFMYNNKRYSGINVYALGFDMYTDIRRICENPTAEDREYMSFAGADWNETILDAVANYKDSSFVSQFLSPALIRKWGFFHMQDDTDKNFYSIEKTANERGYGAIRNALSEQYNIRSYQPDIQVVNANLRGSRRLELEYIPYSKHMLHRPNTEQVMENVKFLWGYDVSITTKTV